MHGSLHPKSIVILDYGGQYAHLIASRVRRFGVFTDIREPETPIEDLRGAAGIILSGGPQSVYDKGSPQADPKIFELGIPVLGICYGLHWMTQTLGGEVSQGKVKEYGRTAIRTVEGGGTLLQDCGAGCTVWMSHGDEAVRLPEGFTQIATSDACENAAFADEKRNFFAIQFHPEVTHSEHGQDILRRFTERCDAAPWSVESYAKEISEQILTEVGDRKVFMLVSGGVDSSVAFTLLNQVLGTERVQGLLVDTGLMRKDEVLLIEKAFAKLGITNLRIENASEEFFANLREVYDPEEKRRIIGDTFLSVQKRVSEEMGLSMQDGWMLGQGTIYPDTIETGATKHADKIKTHHNRVEAVQKMIEAGLVLEPLKDLYKDEVRALGEELGLPHEFVWRHPFPGPGLGVRILCGKEASLPEGDYEIHVDHAAFPIRSVGVQGDGRSYRHAVALFRTQPTKVTEDMLELATKIPNATQLYNRVLLCTSHAAAMPFVFNAGYITKERADLLREADAIADDEMKKAGLYETIWQFPVVLLPFGTTQGGESVVLRPIESIDAMSANAVALPSEVLQKMTERIMNLDGIDLVFLDLTNKPPGTIEWE
ncbi:glutamine-hydrolyzing GMP synthase [Candidatus Peregrinibacteria bacterium CG10_big_fil_rev_8_21_14_0_10_49_24]|nr:MAG: glutamine-hydrolyzing GMP synthase [Candidatus Peregrinibacteria bacterium CG11_big_fil_rev_8_21_14_0_20_49_14]PIR51626.1 MAG: glutamine-hydrolyzing GMP synthase [Candidatus Peregrinibacteria bacterium CG10_big_fil_rev_8_21_14_0_10_49_24]PJA68014.1 MAG: glutamine-hydrolyzing GMP synthase [Candidatus Peregrinibacteria bacterium CG_4_9_14_3_um_filter_49_12]